MTNLEKLNGVFTEIFSVDASVLGAGFDNQSVEGWDSVRQLTLTAALEDTFGIFLDPEDIIACISYDGVKEVLAKYNIEF